jgi:hypothetical protein
MQFGECCSGDIEKSSNKRKRDLYTYVLACKALWPLEFSINVDSSIFEDAEEVPHK